MGKRQKEPAYVLGVGMTKFIKPRGKVDYTELGFEVRIVMSALCCCWIIMSCKI